ncbi:MAG: MFS transporter [Sedimentisphaerales bacterium]|nr:MFS transporter [Sedimentisphaerales bacterium]
MDAKLYFALSFAMFMEFAVWAAWMPVLAARLLGPLKMTGKQTGWIYATLPLACIVSPLVAGVLADKYFETRHIIAVSHLVGAVLLFLVANKTTFKSIFGILLVYCLFYAATLPLVNAILFANVSDAGAQAKVFIWAPVAWALIGWLLTGWRWKFKTGEQGKDCLYFAAILALIMGVGCLILLPGDTPAAAADTAVAADAPAEGLPIFKAMGMLKNANFLLFFVVSMIFFGLMQFYFLGTAQFMQNMGIPSKNVPASMGIAQAVQAAATWFIMVRLTGSIGYKWTLIVGASFWFLLYVVYVMEKPRALIVASQSFHGMAYVLFVIVGQMFANSQASDEIRNSMQALLFAATTGVGLFIGTQFAGFIMDKYRKNEQFQWRSIFMVPCVIALVTILVFMVLFKVPAA